MEDALANPSPVTIFNACANLVLGPARLLEAIGFVRTPPPDTSLGNSTDDTVRAASQAIKRGQMGKALKILTGTGTAPHTPEQIDRTTAMFPPLLEPIKYIPTPDKLTLDPLSLKKQFQKLVSATEPETPDVYGWDPVLFRDQQASERFIPVTCKFLFAFVDWGWAPPICPSFLPAARSFQSTNFPKPSAIYSLPTTFMALDQLEESAFSGRW
jgi:hypothetical protein